MDKYIMNDYLKSNLLIITSLYPNGDGTYIGGSFVKNQVDCLKEHFSQITVICPVLFSFKRLIADKYCKNYSYDNVKVYYPRCCYVPIFYFSRILIDNRLKIVDNLIEQENIKFDLIHAHFTWPCGSIGVKLKKKYDKPVVVTIHENSSWFYQEKNMNYPLINNCWKQANALIRVNSKDIQVLKEYNKNVYSLPNGFSPRFKPLDKNECREKLGLPLDKKILFGLGWLVKRKGFNYLIDSMKNVMETRRDVLCVIGGTGPLYSKLKRQITKLNLEKNIKLIGHITDDLLPLWMNACDIFVLPSLSESFGVVLIEAMACGKPVISTYNGGSEEIVSNKNYGYLVEIKNSSELAEKILKSLDSSWDNEIIRKYAENYNWKDITDKILLIYRSI